MGLIDVLNGMQNGPRGQRAPGTGSGGMSPIAMAILGLLAFKAVKSFTGGQPSTHPASPGQLPGAAPATPASRTVVASAIYSKADWAAYLRAAPPGAF